MAEPDYKIESDSILQNASAWDRYLANMSIEYLKELPNQDSRIPVEAINFGIGYIRRDLQERTAKLDNARQRVTATHSEKEFVSYAHAFHEVIRVIQNALMQSRINRQDGDNILDFAGTADPQERQRAINKLNEGERTVIHTSDEARRKLKDKIQDGHILNILTDAAAASELYTVISQREQGVRVNVWEQASHADIQVPCLIPGKPFENPFSFRQTPKK